MGLNFYLFGGGSDAVERALDDERAAEESGAFGATRGDAGTLQPFHDKIIVVTHCGRICLGRKRISFSTVFAAQAVGIKEVHDDIWLVSFMHYDLGNFDLDSRVIDPLYNPGPRFSPMYPVHSVTNVSGLDPSFFG